MAAGPEFVGMGGVRPEQRPSVASGTSAVTLLKAVDQAQGDARGVREFRSAFASKDIPIQPIIVAPGWWTEARGNYPVKLRNADYLVKYLKGEKARFTRDELTPVIERLDERCRTVEF